MARRRKGSRNYDYSHKSGSEDGLRADKRRTRNFVLITLVLGAILIVLFVYLSTIK